MFPVHLALKTNIDWPLELLELKAFFIQYFVRGRYFQSKGIGFLKVASYQVFTREVTLMYLLFVVVVIQKVSFCIFLRNRHVIQDFNPGEEI